MLRMSSAPSSEAATTELTSSNARLSHVMLKVPSVNTKVKFLTEIKGGKVKVSKEKPAAALSFADVDDDGTGEPELMSAFIELGYIDDNNDDGSGGSSDDGADKKRFALELVASDKENYDLGNVLSYKTISMLLQFQMQSSGAPVPPLPADSSDLTSRFALKTNDLDGTRDFYADVLGMAVLRNDESEDTVSLRYLDGGGDTVTLVFDQTMERLRMGDCFDHLVVATSVDIDALYERLAAAGESIAKRIFMKPTDMFGRRVMGLKDPNGYKVILASE